MKDIVRAIISAGVRAPSGDNCQPWLFRHTDSQIDIHIVPERAKSFFDYEFRGSMISVGAVIENLRTQAAQFNYECAIEYACGIGEQDPAATITLKRSDRVAADTDYLSAMRERTVNRRPYWPGSLDKKYVNEFAMNPVDETGMHFFLNRDEINAWARVVYLADAIRYSHPQIHSDVFSNILLSKREAENRRMGLEIDRLGAGPIAKPLMWLIKPWSRMSNLRKFGMDSLLARHSQLMAIMSGGICLVTVPSDEAQYWIKAGEQTQRLWITAQRLGICVHPMTVALYLGLRYRSAGMKEFLPHHEAILDEMIHGLDRLIPTGIGAMLFRFGKGMRMRSTSIRLPLDRFVTE